MINTTVLQGHTNNSSHTHTEREKLSHTVLTYTHTHLQIHMYHYAICYSDPFIFLKQTYQHNSFQILHSSYHSVIPLIRCTKASLMKHVHGHIHACTYTLQDTIII